MNVLTSDASLGAIETPLLVVPVTAGDTRGQAFDSADAVTQGKLATIADEESFKGKPGSSLLVHTSDHSARRMLLVGVGKGEDLKVDALRGLAASAVKAANSRQLAEVALVMPQGFADSAAAAMATQGAILGAYRYDT